MEILQKSTTTPWRNGNNPYFCRMEKETTIKDEEYSLTPYTMEEIDAMIEEAERDFEAGRFYSTEEVLMDIEEEIKKGKTHLETA